MAEHILVDHHHVSFPFLPPELVESLNQTYFLHLLLTDPEAVIPPGKSLLSMMTHANFHPSDGNPMDDTHAAIVGRVKEVAHRAFWMEAIESLSSPLPSVQLARLKRLYLDLHEALSPLFPPNHRILVALSSPLPPTSSPLHSTLNFLIEILVALRERCAPVRDETIDELLLSLSQPPPSTASQSSEARPSTSDTHSTEAHDSPSTPLAEFVVDRIKAIISLAEDMKTDLNAFVLGSMTEGQLLGLLSNDVKMRERDSVLKLWGGKDAVRQIWRSWLTETAEGGLTLPDDKRWISRLLKALESDKPVYCPLPPTVQSNPDGIDDHSVPGHAQQSNQLPPQLLFSTPALLYAQNCLQAIVIAAALRSLTRLPPLESKASVSSLSPAVSAAHDFMHRIWTLLKTEIDTDSPASDVDHTKIINLADEVVRARQAIGQLDPDEDRRLRAAVERTLRSNDPVFLLLRKRLMSALEELLVSDASTSSNSSGPSIPAKMQTGKDVGEGRAGKRPRLMRPESSHPISLRLSGDSTMKCPTVPGFEDITLQQAILDVSQKLMNCIIWTESVWGDLV